MRRAIGHDHDRNHQHHGLALRDKQTVPVSDPPFSLCLVSSWSQKKVKNRDYKTLYDFRRDVELMIQNAMTFNPPGEMVHTFALEVRRAFEAQWTSAILEYDVLDEQQEQKKQDPPPVVEPKVEPPKIQEEAAPPSSASQDG